MDKKGFTLIELLIVIAIIGILAAAVLVAVDPVGRIQDARNARRSSEANAILNAALNWQVDNTMLIASMPVGGQNPVIQGVNYQVITNLASGSKSTNATCAKAPTAPPAGAPGWANIATLASKYIATIPVDPSGAPVTDSTGYFIRQDANGRITVGACNPENGASGTAPTISVTR